MWVRKEAKSPVLGQKWRLFGQGLSCILSCIFPKKSPFLPQNGRFCFFSYLHCFLLVYQCFFHKHRPKSADKPACTDLSCSYNALSRINSKSIWQQCHVGSNPTVCAKSSTLRGAVFYFCGKLCKGRKVGFEQPASGALRPAGLQQSRGLLQGRGRIRASAPSITTQFYIG